eukprot:10557542-Heterocapsa_arctica.AAC.1
MTTAPGGVDAFGITHPLPVFVPNLREPVRAFLKTERPTRKASSRAGRLALGHRYSSLGRWSAATRPSCSIRAAQVCASSGVRLLLVHLPKRRSTVGGLPPVAPPARNHVAEKYLPEGGQRAIPRDRLIAGSWAHARGLRGGRSASGGFDCVRARADVGVAEPQGPLCDVAVGLPKRHGR